MAIGGPAVAISRINGSRLKNASVAGKKLKKNTVTGARIKESSLGKVPLAASAGSANEATHAATADKAANAASATDASALGGIGPSGYVQTPTEPAGYRPAASAATTNFLQFGVLADTGIQPVAVNLDGRVEAQASASNRLLLEGITFRAG